MREASKSGLDAAIIRPRAIFGANDTALMPRLLRATARGRIPLIDGGRALLDMSYVDNVADVLIAAALHAAPLRGRAYNVSNGEPISVADLMRAVVDGLGLKARFIPIRFLLAYAAAAAMETAANLRPSRPEPVLTRYTVGVLGKTQNSRSIVRKASSAGRRALPCGTASSALFRLENRPCLRTCDCSRPDFVSIRNSCRSGAAAGSPAGFRADTYLAAQPLRTCPVRYQLQRPFPQRDSVLPEPALLDVDLRRASNPRTAPATRSSGWESTHPRSKRSFSRISMPITSRAFATSRKPGSSPVAAVMRQCARRAGSAGLLNGLLPGLMPPDADDRIRFTDAFAAASLPPALADFGQARGPLRRRLGAHCGAPRSFERTGQIGLYLPETPQGDFFAVADAAWSLDAIAGLRPPPRFVTAMLGETSGTYRRTLEHLHRLQHVMPNLAIWPAHCRHEVHA